jgi:hypothetical protein
MKNLFNLAALVMLLAITGCKKDTITYPNSSKPIEIEDGTVPLERGVEMACVIGDKAGTKCVNGANGKCKLYACKAVNGQIQNITPTPAQIETMAHLHAQELVNLELIEPVDFEESKNVAIQSLTTFYY